MCKILPKLEAKTLKNMKDMKQIFQNFHSKTKNVKVKMTLTFILEVFCRRNLFVFERHCNGVNEDKAQRQYENRLRNNKLKYEKMTQFKPISCFCDLGLNRK